MGFGEMLSACPLFENASPPTGTAESRRYCAAKRFQNSSRGRCIPGWAALRTSIRYVELFIKIIIL
jgi:hypothetical protein